MERSDFYERGTRKIDFLQDYRIISRWACETHDLRIADLELLFYLHPLKYFTRQQFQDGTLMCSWDRKRFERLLDEDWIMKSYEGNRRLGEHHKYALSSKGNRLVNRIYRILCKDEDIPMTVQRNIVMRKKKYSHKRLSKAIEKKKERDDIERYDN